MYFCNDISVNNNTRKGIYKKINYLSSQPLNDWTFENGVVNIVDGSCIMFAVRDFGFYKPVDIDLLFCNDDYMLIKLLSGSIYIKGNNAGATVTLKVDADGEVELIENSDENTVRWYDSKSIRLMLDNSIKYQNSMPDDFEPSISMYNNLIFTLNCENKVIRSSVNSMCVNIRPNLITPVIGYDYDEALNKARVEKPKYGITPEIVEAQALHYLENKEAIDKAFEERKNKGKEEKPKKPSTRGMKKASKSEYTEDDIDPDVLAMIEAEDEEEDYYDVDSDDVSDGLTSEELQEILFGVQLKEASLHNNYEE